jgi:IS5 family transposase
MSTSPGGSNRQREMFARSTRPTIPVNPSHRLAVLEKTIDWTELERRAQMIRSMKLKNGAGSPPHLRALNGAMVLGAGRTMSYREAEDQIRHYAPARLLCGLTETEWSPDHRTIHDYAKLMGPEGMQLFNEYAVGLAVEKKLADPSVLVADTTAQEAAIPHPNEMGLMAAFLSAVGVASERAGHALREFALKVDGRLKAAKKKVREYRLFTKKKTAVATKRAKKKILAEMTSIVEGVQGELGKALVEAAAKAGRLRKYGRVAHAKLVCVHRTMETLLPQIRYWVTTGKVAADKIINLHIPELYSIVRGKLGKAVEFGLRWGVRRIKGGFVLLTMAHDSHDLHDSDYAVAAVDEHIGLFGKPPHSYAYDRGGWSDKNVSAIKERGVPEVGLAP